ncbi:MAG: prephenate dehydrogenase/arogenate dehydrogenase family protein, partial [Alphaproteobacteria bacterium]
MTENITGEPLFERLALIGVGLIGSSIALAARRSGLVGEIVVQTRRLETLDAARRLNLGDRYTSDLADAVADADLVIVCVPICVCGDVAKAIAPA